MAERSRYLSYLLRMWQTGDDQDRIWIASLEEPGTRERRGFASLDDLFDFLRQQAGLPPEPRTALGDGHTANGKAQGSPSVQPQ